MVTLTAITLLIHGLMIVLVMGALLIITIFLHDSSRPLSGYFSMFMVGMLVWTSGSFLSRTTAQVSVDTSITTVGVWLIEIGFGVVCAIAPLMAAHIVQMRSRLFFWTIIGAIVVMIVYRVLLINLDVGVIYEIKAQSRLSYGFPTLNRWVQMGLSLALITIVWRYFAKFERPITGLGFLILGVGQLIALVSLRLRELTVAENSAAIATVLIIYGIVQSDVIVPFLRRTRQVEIVQDVGVAITNLREDKVLETIAARAANLLDANGSAIYLVEEDGMLLLSAVHQLPEKHVGICRIRSRQGFVGRAFAERKSTVTTHYWRDMHNMEHEGFPPEPIGAAVAVPLTSGEQVLGVLLVVADREGHLFSEEYVSRLQLIAPQAAVTIRNNRLLEHERDLKLRLLAQQTQLQTVLSSTSNPVLAIDWRGRILFANDAALALLDTQYLINPLEMHNIVEFVKPEWLPSDLRQLRRDVRYNHAHIYDLHIDRTDFLCHITRLQTATRGWVVVLNDVTTLKEVDRLKSQTIRMTSHDLKNPLFSLMSYLELIEEDTTPFFSDVTRQNMATVWTQINRMSQLINNILNLERVQIGNHTVMLFDVRDVLASAHHNLDAMARHKELNLMLDINDEPLLVMGDQQLLLQAVTNLADNAIKFTPSKGTVTLRGLRQADQVIIEVTDTGIGIAVEHQIQVFDRFFRVTQGRTKDDTGSGLGLSLVKAIVEQHTGQITLESQENIGTTFCITLPLAKTLVPLS